MRLYDKLHDSSKSSVGVNLRRILVSCKGRRYSGIITGAEGKRKDYYLVTVVTSIYLLRFSINETLRVFRQKVIMAP